jgi:serine/threonine-protein kinase
MYMPPEQISGTDLDHRADMYALGASFYNLLAGVPPYDGDAVTIMAKHMQDPVPSLRAKNPAVPVALARIIERLMQKEPEKRYATYGDLLTALEAAEQGAVEPAGFAIRAAAAVIDLGIGAAAVAFLGPLGAGAYLAALIASQAFTGQTAGKWLVRIRAERTDGTRLGPARAAARVATAAWLPLLVAGVVLATRGTDDLFAIVGRAAQIDQMRGLLTAFAVGNAALSLLYAACLAFAAIHPAKRAAHDLLVGSRVVHVRKAAPSADPSRKSRISI